MKPVDFTVTMTLLLTAALCADVGEAAPAAEEVARRAHTYMQARSDSGAFSGAVLIARGGTTLFSRAYGFANEEWQIRNETTTRFPIASVTKTFTAALVLKLQEQRLLGIEDPICKHLAPCPKHWQPITVRHLLMHTAGIPDYARTPDFLQKVSLRRALPELVAEFRDRPLEFAPGAKYAYSNSNYILLGQILEKVGGKTYEQLLSEHFFAPLDMRDSGLDANDRVLARRASGYRPDGSDGRRFANAAHVDTSWLYAAGAIYSTVDDLLKWDRALRSGAVLPRAQVDLMWSAKHGPYGYGWQLLGPSAQTLNRRLVFHAGGTTGFASDLLLYPEQDVTIVLLANLLPVPLAEISRHLSAIAFGEAPGK
jgi:CubicO group peptidase (beta-lactamase class C family)